MSLNKWQRLFVALGAAAFLAWAWYVIENDSTPRPETALLAGILLAVWAANSRKEGEEWLPVIGNIRRPHIIGALLIGAALLVWIIARDSILREMPTEEATEMAMEYSEPIATPPMAIPSVAPVRPDVPEELESEIATYERLRKQMFEASKRADPVAETVDAIQAEDATASRSYPDTQR